jgi:hypothetical protein
VVGGTDTEKAVPLDDPQIEFGAFFFKFSSFWGGWRLNKRVLNVFLVFCFFCFFAAADARSWRLRCRIMAIISLFTYIPFIVCIAIFAGH